MQLKILSIIITTLLLFLFFSFPLVINNVVLSSEESMCLNELIGILDPGQDWGVIKVTSKEGNKIYLRLYTLVEFNREWIAECPEGHMGSVN